MGGKDLKRMRETVCLDARDKIRLLPFGKRTEKVCAAYVLRLCPGVFVYHLLCDDLSHSPPALFRESYRSGCVSTCEQNNPNAQYIMFSISASMTSSAPNRSRGAIGFILCACF